MRTYFLSIFFIVFIGLQGCKDGTGVFLFSLEDDRNLGAQVDEQIRTDPQFNILNRAGNEQAYQYLEGMRDIILNSGEVKFQEEFDWEIIIIEDDVLNAFVTPGGYMYFYTGIMKYLDDASSLAGVMGHEIGHADRRHSSRRMQQQFGIQTLLQVATGGDPGLLAQVGAALLQLQFSRADETESDNQSVKYLCPTDFKTDGAASFFQKITDEGGAQTPQFLSTHPNPDNRVQNIQDKASEASCPNFDADPIINGLTYDQFKNILT